MSPKVVVYCSVHKIPYPNRVFWQNPRASNLTLNSFISISFISMNYTTKNKELHNTSPVYKVLQHQYQTNSILDYSVDEIQNSIQ